MTELEKSFDPIADEYDRARPSYPESIFDRIIDYAGLAWAARVLEVGTGTGKATEALARRGFPMLCLEPGPRLAQLARARLAPYPNVDVQAVSFEAWTAPIAAFDLAFAAQAFHWLAPEERLPKFARALRRPGTLAIFGNSSGVAAGPLRAAIQAAYAQLAPALRSREAASHVYGSDESPIFQELRESPLFTDARCEITTWEKTLSTAEYCAVNATYSDHSTLPAAQLQSLLGGIAKVVDEHGGKVQLDYRTGLFLARAV